MYQPHSYLFDRIGREFGLCRIGVVVVMIATYVGAYAATSASIIL